jgi:hypothetical protein
MISLRYGLNYKILIKTRFLFKELVIHLQIIYSKILEINFRTLLKL